ncbi:MAG: family 10 glycosylhydrolase [Candidatus Hydrogenedentes bacterium]|nr:family 10 glycosylhydrolase [Candidatus Hydrogenedentota bacterium]
MNQNRLLSWRKVFHLALAVPTLFAVTPRMAQNRLGCGSGAGYLPATVKGRDALRPFLQVKQIAILKILLWSCLCAGYLFPLATGAAVARETLYLTDMSRCKPAESLSEELRPNRWRMIPYKTEEIQGTLLGAASYIEAPEVRLPLNQTGWYAVYLGIWNPHLMYDGKPVIKARLSSRPVFQQIHPGGSPDTQATTYIEEVRLCDADLGDEQYIAFGKSNGLQPRSAYVAYVKLVPLTEEQIRLEGARRGTREHRNLVATFDGASILHFSECSTVDHLLEWVEKLRNSDTKKVLWAVTYGDRTGFPTKNLDLSYLGAEDQVQPSSVTFGNDYQRGQRQIQQFFKNCAEAGVVPQQALAEHAHGLGMNFDLMYRIGILGGLGLSSAHHNNYVQSHPEVRQVTHEGYVLEKASLAFPEVQQLILDQIAESCRQIDADGINLCFVRGPHFLLWEKPVRDAFEAKYGVSSADVAENDPRIDEVRAAIVTDFMQRVRGELDAIGKERGRALTLSVWVWPHEQNVWLGKRPIDEGLDVEAWIRMGLLDSVICQEGIDTSYMALGKEHGCEFVLFTGYRGDKAMSPKTLTDAFQQGVASFAYWDIDAVQNDPRTWRWLRQTGDRERLLKFYENPDLLKRRLIPLQEVNGVDVEHGLADAVYSGG